MNKKQESKNLKELRDIAYIITKDRKISLKWSEKAETASYNFENNEITLTDNCLPKGTDKMPKTWKKALDGLVSHEAAHRLLSTPIWSRYERFINRKPLKDLAHTITNIIEDKRINRFIESRYRFDYGKRLNLVRRLIKSQIENHLDEKKPKMPLSEGDFLVSCLIDKGLYEASISDLEAKLSSNGKKDLKILLNLLEEARYMKVKQYLLETSEKMYSIIEKYAPTAKMLQFVPQLFAGGKISGGIGKELQKELEKEEKKDAQNEAENDKKDLKRGGGAGGGTGDELPAPEVNYGAYFELVERNKPEIEKLLAKLKRFVKPIVKREIFRKRGRIMSPILSKAYLSSFNKPQERIYINSTVEFEKQKVAICINVDLSGSMDESEAKNVLTTLNEVFGNWLEDKAFGIMAFASEFCKIKTFFEAFDNTRARIGGDFNIGGGTVVSPSLKAIQELFNGMNGERSKILVLVSDFDFFSGDEHEAKRILENMAKSGISLLFVELSSYGGKSSHFCRNLKNVYRMSIKRIEDLPDLFVDIYEKAITLESFN